MRFTFDVPDELVPAVAEIMAQSETPGWEDGVGRCSPRSIMERLKITPDQYSAAAGALSGMQQSLEDAAEEMARPAAPGA